MTKSPGSRMHKVNELMREVIAEALNDLKDPRIGFVTITGVNTAPDLRNAVVYYSVLGSAGDEEATAAALASSAARVQRAVGSETRLKFTPKLTFVVDASIKEGDRIDRILRDIEVDDTERQA